MIIKEIVHSLMHKQYNLNFKYFNNKAQFSRHKLSISLFTMRNILRRPNNINLRLQKPQIHKVNFLKMFMNNLIRVPQAFKEQSVSLLRLWTHQCECVIAQRVRRGQQMFSLYSRMWEEHALREVLKRARQQMVNHGKKLLIGATGISVFNWEMERINDKEIMQYAQELEHIHLLTSDTITCCVCHKRKKFDEEISNVSYCTCPSSDTKSCPTAQSDWIPFLEREDVLIWRKEEVPKKFSYKCYGSYKDVNAEDFLQVQIDVQYRKTWDVSAIDLKIIDSDPESNSDIIYWEMKWPRFFANRDYVFKRRYIVDRENNLIIIVSKAINHDSCPVESSKIRVEQYWSFMVIRPHTTFNEPGVEFGLTYFDDPGITVPEKVTSWVVASGMPEFLLNMRKASKSYQDYLKNKLSRGDDNDLTPVSVEEVDVEFNQLGEEYFEELDNDTSEETYDSDSSSSQDCDSSNEADSDDVKQQDDDNSNQIDRNDTKHQEGDGLNEVVDDNTKQQDDNTYEKPNDKKVIEDVNDAINVVKVESIYNLTPESEVMTAPSAITTPEIEKHAQTYWKYLYPFSYFY